MSFSSARSVASQVWRDAPPTEADTIASNPSIGDLIRATRKLTDQQIEQILAFQRKRGLRFGEAAVALQLATNDDVLWALAQQYHYSYVPTANRYRNRELVVANSPFSDEAEIFRELRTQLLMGVLSSGAPRRALAVLSPNVGDGKSYLAANIALAFSQLGGRTVLVDADMRTPRQHAMFGVSNGIGLSGILSGRAEYNAVRQIKGLPSLFILPVGSVPPNPQELVQGPAFALLLHELLKKFDHVVVDTPAAEYGADCRVAASRCGAAVVIGRRGRSSLAQIRALLRGLGQGAVKVAGVVINEF